MRYFKITNTKFKDYSENWDYGAGVRIRELLDNVSRVCSDLEDIFEDLDITNFKDFALKIKSLMCEAYDYIYDIDDEDFSDSKRYLKVRKFKTDFNYDDMRNVTNIPYKYAKDMIKSTIEILNYILDYVYIH